MRNIMHTAALHNRSTWMVAAVCMAVLTGCGGEKTPQPAPGAESAAVQTTPDTVAGVRVNTASLDAWLNLVARVETGATLRESDCAALLELPGYQAFYGEEGASHLDPAVLQTVIEHVFSPRGSSREPKRTDLVTNYEYLANRQERARAFARRFATARFQNTLRDLAARFLGDALPDPLTIHPVAATTSIAFVPPGDLALDAGLAFAAGQDLAARLCASRLWDALQPMEGPEPHATGNGTLALVATFRKLHHRAIHAWIVGAASPVFDHRHAGLGDTRIQVNDDAQRAVGLCTRTQAMLQGQLGEAGAALRAEHGGDIDLLLRLRGGYEILGYAMADLVARQAGIEGLAAAADSPAEFLLAYQSAALDPTVNTTLPAFETVQLKQLIDLLGD